MHTAQADNTNSDFGDLDEWMTTELKPQLPVERRMRPAVPALVTPVLLGYIMLWHNRTCDNCGSEHDEFVGAYACYRHPNGNKSIKLSEAPEADCILPVLHRKVQRIATICSECYEPSGNDEAAALTLSTFEGMLE